MVMKERQQGKLAQDRTLNAKSAYIMTVLVYKKGQLIVPTCSKNQYKCGAILVIKKSMSKGEQDKERSAIIKSLDLIQASQQKQVRPKLRAPSVKVGQESNLWRKKDILFQTLNIFYTPISYSFPKTYVKSMQEFTGHYISTLDQSRMNEIMLENNIQRSLLRIELLQIYRDTLAQVAQVQDKQNVKETFTQLDEFIFNRLFTQKTNIQQKQRKTRSVTNNQSFVYIPLFKLQNGNQEAFRRSALQSCFKDALCTIREKKKDGKSKKVKKIFGPVLIDHIYLLTACQSFVTDIQPLKVKLDSLVETIKQSWYVAQSMTKFLNGRKGKLKRHKQCPSQINIEAVRNILKQFKVAFIDHASNKQAVYTYTLDHNKMFPVFVNFFKFFNINSVDQDLILSYALVVILHQLGHWILRKLNIIQPNESSFPDSQQKLKKDQQIKPKVDKQTYDGGWVFQKYLFGKRVDQITSEDYNKFLPLLLLKQSPDPSRTNWDLQENWKKVEDYFEFEMKETNNQKKQSKENDQKIQKPSSVQINKIFEVETNQSIQEENANLRQLLKQKKLNKFDFQQEPIRLYQKWKQLHNISMKKGQKVELEERQQEYEESEEYEEYEESEESEESEKSDEKEEKQGYQKKDESSSKSIKKIKKLIKQFQQLGNRVNKQKPGVRTMPIRASSESFSLRTMEMPPCGNVRMRWKK